MCLCAMCISFSGNVCLCLFANFWKFTRISVSIFHQGWDLAQKLQWALILYWFLQLWIWWKAASRFWSEKSVVWGAGTGVLELQPRAYSRLAALEVKHRRPPEGGEAVTNVHASRLLEPGEPAKPGAPASDPLTMAGVLPEQPSRYLRPQSERARIHPRLIFKCLTLGPRAGGGVSSPR